MSVKFFRRTSFNAPDSVLKNMVAENLEKLNQSTISAAELLVRRKQPLLAMNWYLIEKVRIFVGLSRRARPWLRIWEKIGFAP